MAEVIEEAIKGLEATDILVDEITDSVRVPNIKLLLSSTSVLSLGVGLGAGYFIALKRLESKYSKLADAEIDEMREHFQRRTKAQEPKPDLSDLTAAYSPQEEPAAEIPVDPVVDPQNAPMAVPPTVVEDISQGPVVEDGAPLKNNYTALKEDRNVFRDQPDPSEVGPAWDYARETKLRSAQNGVPYVIHQEELGEEDDMDCTSFTYFDGDDILCNERDEIIDNHERETLLNWSQNHERFGHGSGETDVVYIRNTAIGQEFEVRRSQGTYTQEVQGINFDDDTAGGSSLAHSDMPRRRRPWDDA